MLVQNLTVTALHYNEKGRGRWTPSGGISGLEIEHSVRCTVSSRGQNQLFIKSFTARP